MPSSVHASQAVWLELLALSGIGACLANNSFHRDQAAMILTYALRHQQLPLYSFATRPALQRLKAELASEQLAAARQAAAAATLEQLEQTARESI